MRRTVWVLLVVALIGGLIYWQVNKRLNAPLLPTGEQAQSQLAARVAAQNEGAFYQPAPQPLQVQPANPDKNVYFGDLHVHTSLSFDAYLFGTRLDPDAAYQIAKGGTATVATGERIQLTRPLDFVALTDHAEGFGLHEACRQPNLSDAAAAACGDFDVPSARFFLQLRNSGEVRPPVSEL